MKFGVVFPMLEPCITADLALEVEEAGWDGVFYWDGILSSRGRRGWNSSLFQIQSEVRE